MNFALERIKNFGTACCLGVCDSFKFVPVLINADKELKRRQHSRLSPTHSVSPVRRKRSESREATPVKTVPSHEESTLWLKIWQCAFLNGVMYLLSIAFFSYMFLPGIRTLIMFIFGSDSPTGQSVWLWVEFFLNFVFKTMWIIPLYIISRIINTLWFQDIGQYAFKYSRGRANSSLSFSKWVADFIFGTVVEVLFLLQNTLLYCVIPNPIGSIWYYSQISLLYSLYSFEYKWSEMGWEIHKRLIYIERCWAYFIGFGLPLAIISNLSDTFLINGGIFAMFFPLYIVSASEANPLVESCPSLNFFCLAVGVCNMTFGTLKKEKKMPANTPTQSRK